MVHKTSHAFTIQYHKYLHHHNALTRATDFTLQRQNPTNQLDPPGWWLKKQVPFPTEKGMM